MTDTLPILRHSSARMSKHWLPDGTLKPYDDAKYFRLEERPVDSLAALAAVLADIERDPHACVIRGAWAGAEAAQARDPEYRQGKVRRALAQFDDKPRQWLMIDVDRYEPIAGSPVGDEEIVIREFVHACLPRVFWGVSCYWQHSSSAGSAGTAGVMKMHLWFWLDSPLGCEELTLWAKTLPHVDAAVFRVVQPHYTARPTFAEGVADPVVHRSGMWDGLSDDTVRLRIDRAACDRILAERGIAHGGAGGGSGASEGRAVVLRGVISADPIAQRLNELRLVRGQARAGELNITCPFSELHTGGSDAETATQYFPAHTHGFVKGNFKCMHAHCDGRPRVAWLARIGLTDDDGTIRALEAGEDPTAPPSIDVEGYDAVPDPDEQGGADGQGTGAGGSGDANASPVLGELDLKSIPKAKHLCTDQANAGRLAKRFKGRAFVADGVWYTWDGRRWAQDERDVWVQACRLSAIVKEEAAAWAARQTDDIAQQKVNVAVAVALEKWSSKCEMRGTIEAAVGLVRKILAVDSERLDADGWLLNCANGTVDLRTGALRPHDPADWITKLAPVDYVPDANQGERGRLWRRTMAQITLELDGWGEEGGPMCAFLQRWSGYCATGSVREQVFVVHHGDGRNGKSTELEVIGAALGDYASSAAPGLLAAGRGERHPTEIADLKGRRMVTAHETGEGCVLREDFIKQATGGDIMKARVMRGDFFEFKPTHKLQLLTNHKPVIKGQDSGIWRRVLLVPYMARFGDAAALAAGDAHYLRDLGLMGRLMAPAELESVLAWIVEGAVAWAAEGLMPPEAVLAASRSYQSEQDRIGTFVGECCELAAGAREPLTAGLAGGLYPEYSLWCKESGILALSRQRFLAGLEKIVPGFSVRKEKTSVAGGARREVSMVYGLRLLEA